MRLRLEAKIGESGALSRGQRQLALASRLAQSPVQLTVVERSFKAWISPFCARQIAGEQSRPKNSAAATRGIILATGESEASQAYKVRRVSNAESDPANLRQLLATSSRWVRPPKLESDATEGRLGISIEPADPEKLCGECLRSQNRNAGSCRDS